MTFTSHNYGQRHTPGDDGDARRFVQPERIGCDGGNRSACRHGQRDRDLRREWQLCGLGVHADGLHRDCGNVYSAAQQFHSAAVHDDHNRRWRDG